ncbi:MAG: carboxypeptidase-like regulatory domain-containing protein, partial [Polyangiaceae bacterium]
FYPPVPGPALVEGVVVGTDAEPVPSQLDFISVGGSGVLSQDGNNFDLRYRTSVHTAADGSYSVRLPRGAPIKQTTEGVVKGHYNVVVTPDPGTGYSVVLKTLNNAFLVPEDTAGTHDNAVQKGKGFTMSRLTVVTGHVTLTDGRPLGGVVVEARPSSAFDKYDPLIPSELFSIMPVTRPASTTTDANGFYTLPLDPGLYDFFAKAPASSGFAWGVTTAHKTDAPVDIQVRAPIDASMRIYQTNTSTLQGALVRAYVAAGPDLTQIQIGEGTTDANGILTLFLSPELPK